MIQAFIKYVELQPQPRCCSGPYGRGSAGGGPFFLSPDVLGVAPHGGKLGFVSDPLKSPRG